MNKNALGILTLAGLLATAPAAWSQSETGTAVRIDSGQRVYVVPNTDMASMGYVDPTERYAYIRTYTHATTHITWYQIWFRGINSSRPTTDSRDGKGWVRAKFNYYDNGNAAALVQGVALMRVQEGGTEYAGEDATGSEPIYNWPVGYMDELNIRDENNNSYPEADPKARVKLGSLWVYRGRRHVEWDSANDKWVIKKSGNYRKTWFAGTADYFHMHSVP